MNNPLRMGTGAVCAECGLAFYDGETLDIEVRANGSLVAVHRRHREEATA